MKIAFLTSIYPKHAEEIYEQNTELSKNSSEEQMEYIRWHALSSYVRWFELLEQRGFKTCIFNCCLPKVEFAWAKENKFITKSKNPVMEIGKEKIRRFKPDLIYCFAPTLYIANGYLDELLGEFSLKPKTIAWYGANVGDENIFNCVDLTLSNSKHLVKKLCAKGIKADFLQHSFDPIILEHIETHNIRKKRMGFFGNIDVSTIDFEIRTKTLERLASTSKNFDIFGQAETPTIKETVKFNLLKYRQYTTHMMLNICENNKIKKWAQEKNMPPNPWKYSKKFARKIRKPKFGKEMLQDLIHYLIAFNFHNQHTGNFACNMRLFETTGLGCALLTDNKSDIGEYFENGKEVLTYNCVDDAIEKMDFLLNNQSFAHEMGKLGQNKCIESHNTSNIINILCQHLQKLVLI